MGRRERNKQEKLARIVAAASELFAKHGVDEVTTQQIAEAADIGAGTLFLYAHTKGDLLLLVQNAHHADALAAGKAAASGASSATNAVLALYTPLVLGSRALRENGRTYLREMIFGDPSNPHCAEALEIVAETEAEVARLISAHDAVEDARAHPLACMINATVYLLLAEPRHVTTSTDELLTKLREYVNAALE